ncbi:MAG: fimbria/pilus outer membrane usher protein, partial [Candidatus Eremiobacteraeota bacterium]|nr:fimbria/pilus outer membrane usher protein [Candidatus Eremiobacteraeota bacterium]
MRRLGGAPARLAAAIAVCLACLGAAATVDGDGAFSFVTLYVNSELEGEAVAIMRDDDLLLPVVTLERAGVGRFAGNRETVRGHEYVSLRSLAPGITFTFDRKALAVHVTARSGTTTKIDLDNTRPANIEYTKGAGGFVNYAITGAGGSGTLGFFQGAIARGENSYNASFTAATNDSLRRGLLYYQIDDRDALVRQVIGDVNAASGDLGGSSYMAGYGIARNFALDPYAIHYPLPGVSGVLSTPSVADVYVNGVLVRQVNLPPGAYNLNNLPVTSGIANATVVITDAFGRSQTFGQSYYAVPTLLTVGTTDYQYAVGLLRQNAFAYGDSYGPGAAVGRYRLGVTNTLTLGGRFEATPSLVSGGPEVDLGTGFGDFHFALAASEDAGLSGGGMTFGYAYTTPRFGLFATVLGQGPYYANVSQAPALDRAISATSAATSYQTGNNSTLTFQFLRQAMRDSGTSAGLSLSETIAFTGGYSVILTASRDTSTTAAPTANFTAVFRVSENNQSVSVGGQTGTNPGTRIEAEGAPVGKYGIDYTAAYDPSFDRAAVAAVTYRTQYGDAGFN